jgi:hypothetical protein
MTVSANLHAPLGPEPGSWIATRRVVISGSMTFFGEMRRTAERLASDFVKSTVPVSEELLPATMSAEQYDAFKRDASFRHIRRIRDPRTFALLALNFDKHDIRDYIGPSTFAEIAVAAVSGKRIYLIGDYPEVYAEELATWGVIRLYGRLAPLIRDYSQECMKPSPQLRLFA